MSGLLKIENLVMVRGTKVAVNGIKLQIAPGRITVLLGPNGAGKTSTVLGISGVVEPAFGEIWMDGVDLKGKEPDEIRRAGIATVPEGHQVLREMSVMDNLRVAGGELSRGDLSVALQHTLDLFPELKAKLALQAGDLSGGQQQMVAIGRALMSRPKLLLLDEPFLGLAPKVVEEIRQALNTLRGEGLTMILVEQKLDIALPFTSRTHVMIKGQLALVQKSAELMRDPDLGQLYFRLAQPAV